MKTYDAMENDYIPDGYNPYIKKFAIAALCDMQNEEIEILIFQYRKTVFLYYRPSNTTKLSQLCENIEDIEDLFLIYNPNFYKVVYYNKKEFNDIKQLDPKKDFTLYSFEKGRKLILNYLKNNLDIDEETGEIL